MTITNYLNKYLKVQSDRLNNFLTDIANYSSIEVTVKKGCDGVSVVTTLVPANIATNTWIVDLTEAVKLENIVYQLFVKNIVSGKEYNILGSSTIDLSYVIANCTSSTNSCTLQSFQTHFAPIFKTAIDSWFTTNGITSNVTVTFSGNSLIVANTPTSFGFSRIDYDSQNIAPYNEAVFGYTGNSAVIISDNSLYISPSFLGDTTLKDAVYQVYIKYTKTNNTGYVSETTCAFIDVLTKCRIATQLNTLIQSSFSEETDNLMLLHYALTVGSNCGCNCADLCATFNQLSVLLGVDPVTGTVSQTSILNSSSTITSDCGC